MIDNDIELIKKMADKEELQELIEEYGENLENFTSIFDDKELNEYLKDDIENE